MRVGYRIRRATDDDLANVSPLWRRLVEFEASLSPRFAVKPDAESLWLDELKEDRAAQRADVFVVEARPEGAPESRIVAFLHVRATRGAPFHVEDRIGFVDGVWVEPEHRKIGLAKRLIAEAENWCRVRRLTILEAGVVTANREALAAWEHLGFALTTGTVTRPIAREARDARAAVAKAFDEQAPRAAASAYVQAGKRARRLVDFSRSDASCRLLEVGCGTGTLLAAFRDHAADRVGVEISPEMARHARASGAAVVLAAAEHLPFKDGTFHRVVSRATLHHLPHAEAGLREMARVVAPGGSVALEDLVASEDAERAKRHNALEALRDPSHHRMLSPGEMARAAEAAGLELEETLTVREPRDLESWLALSKPPPEVADEVRRVAAEYASRAEADETGLLIRRLGDDIRFDHTHLLLRAGKPKAERAGATLRMSGRAGAEDA